MKWAIFEHVQTYWAMWADALHILCMRMRMLTI